MAFIPTHYPLAQFTASGGETSVTFSSIPTTDVNGETLRDLVLLIAGTASANASTAIEFNGDSNSNYGFVTAYGDGLGSVTSSENASQTRLTQQYLFTNPTANRINIFNYSNTDRYKTVLTHWGTPANGVQIAAEIWRSTAAINSLTFSLLGGATMNAGTTVTMFGLVGQ